MAMKQVKQELRGETVDKLAEKLDQAKSDLVKLRFELSINKSTKSAQYASKRREIARLNTLIREKKQSQNIEQKAS